MQEEIKYPYAIKKRVIGDWNCPKCDNLNFSFRTKCNKCACLKQASNPFNCTLYIFPPPLNEELSEKEAFHYPNFDLAQIPSISTFLNDDPLEEPIVGSYYSKSIRKVEKENSIKGSFSTGGTEETSDHEKISKDIMKYVKKPNTKKQGDWLCLKCKNLNFAFRKICNICRDPKTDYIQI